MEVKVLSEHVAKVAVNTCGVMDVEVWTENHEWLIGEVGFVERLDTDDATVKVHFAKGRIGESDETHAGQSMWWPCKALGRHGSSLRALFDAADSDASGSLDIHEIAQVSHQLFGTALSGEDLVAAMKEMDGDGNGDVDFEEFKTWWEGRGGKTAAEEDLRIFTDIERMFKELDTDGSGDLDREEVRQLFVKMGTPINREADLDVARVPAPRSSAPVPGRGALLPSRPWATRPRASLMVQRPE